MNKLSLTAKTTFYEKIIKTSPSLTDQVQGYFFPGKYSFWQASLQRGPSSEGELHRELYLQLGELATWGQ